MSSNYASYERECEGCYNSFYGSTKYCDSCRHIVLYRLPHERICMTCSDKYVSRTIRKRCDQCKNKNLFKCKCGKISKASKCSECCQKERTDALRELEEEKEHIISICQKSLARKAAKKMGLSSYSEYLRSETWKNRRKEYYKKYIGKCVVCGCEQNLHLHHITYDRLGIENDEDLCPLCEHHHNLTHAVLNQFDAIDPLWLLACMNKHHNSWKDYNQQFLDLIKSLTKTT